MAEFSKGQRVRPSQLYKTEFPHVGSDKRFGGGLVQEAANNMAKVLWDGWAKPEWVHVDYLAEEVLI